MHDQKQLIPKSTQKNLLPKCIITLFALSAVGLCLWGWIQQNPEAIPSPESQPGKAILLDYQVITHGIWLTLLGLSLTYLANRIYINQKKEALRSEHRPGRPIESVLKFLRRNPATSVLFIVYTVAMISGTTYLHKDMLGWYPDLVKGHFLDNFSIRESFIRETMQRSDYRFFPLAHQDLHVLSWFTIHIKTWMLFSAAELIAIVVLCVKFLKDLEFAVPARQSTVLLIAVTLLIHPSTGTSFFHVIYCERLLGLAFMLFITSYLAYRQTQKASTFYLTLFWALLGLYIKDIAIILFTIPPASLWISDAIQAKRTKKQNDILQNTNHDHCL